MSTRIDNAARRSARCSAGAWRALLLTAITTAPVIATAQDGQGVHERLIGTYRLARYAAHGAEPVGRISYDASGRMWAMLLPPGRAPLDRDSAPEQYRDTMRGVVAYYGTYTIDEATQRVIHHVEAASNPAWIGDDFIRWYRFEGPNLLISLNPSFDNSLLWERLAERPPVAVSDSGTTR